MYPRNREEHVEDLKVVLQELQKHQQNDKLNKWEFYNKHFYSLGHIILEEGIS
jgi:hypothetical protein